MKNKKKIENKNLILTIAGIILILIVGIFIWKFVFTGDGDNLKISQDVIDRCNKFYEIQSSCEPDSSCMDGFGEICYFNSNKYSMNDLELGAHSLSEEIKNRCTAVYTYAVCSCEYKFEIGYMSGFKEELCENFYQTIKNLNQSCDGCMKTVGAGCC